MHQQKDITGEISFSFRYDVLVLLYRQCQNNFWNFCIYWGRKSFQNLYSLCSPKKRMCWKERKVMFPHELNNDDLLFLTLCLSSLTRTNTWLFHASAVTTLWSLSNRSVMIRAFKVLPWWEMMLCYFSSGHMVIYLSSAAFPHCVCSCTVDKRPLHHSISWEWTWVLNMVLVRLH